MFIPLKDLNPRRTYPFINTTLILVNVLVFLYQYSLPPHTFKVFMTTYATIPARFPAWLSGHAPLESAFVPLLTSMFLHSGVLHIAGNMLFLWIFGDNVEDFYGHFTYLFFYLFCGIGSGLLHVAFNMTSAVPALGASGAISGVMGAYLILYPRSQILTLVFVFGSLGSVASGGVAWWAHVGGFLLGMLITTMLRGQQRSARWQSS